MITKKDWQDLEAGMQKTLYYISAFRRTGRHVYAKAAAKLLKKMRKDVKRIDAEVDDITESDFITMLGYTDDTA